MLQRQNLWAGAVLILFGVGVIAAGSSLPYGTATRMGSGFMPFWLAIMAIVFGGVILLRVLTEGERVSIPLRELRPAVFVTTAIIAFALLVEGAGFLIASFTAAVTATLASPGVSVQRNLIQSALIAAASAALFLGLLRINLPLLPR